MEDKQRYNHLNKFLKDKFGERTLKICIDGGFTCPNRDGKSGIGGCIFCSEKGSGEHIKSVRKNISNEYINLGTENVLTESIKSGTILKHNQDIKLSIESISSQIRNYFNTYKAQRANKFIAYFQNFTNTYDTLENLKLKYDAAFIDDRIVALAVATRPDCINEDIAKLLKSYSNKYYVWVELGLQTSNDNTGDLINRGYTSLDFTKAVDILNKYGIDVVTHIMVGLPNEGQQDIMNTTNFINMHNIQGLKIHSCYVIENTKLAEMYKAGKYQTLELDYYLECVSYIISHISPDIVIHRVSGDAPKDILLAPSWNSHKKWIINGLDKLLKKENLWQGKYYTK